MLPPMGAADEVEVDRLDLARAAEAASAHRVLADLVSAGAALGWVDPPTYDEVARLLGRLAAEVAAGDASVRVARVDGRLVGIGWWRRYERPTHRPHADLEKVGVATGLQGRGIGAALTAALVDDARSAGIEVLTLDLRGDNATARGVYDRLGFVEYGRLPGFVAVGERRWDKVLMLLDLRRA